MLPISSVASTSFQFSFFNPQLETRNQQPTLALELETQTISIGNIKKHKVIIESDTVSWNSVKPSEVLCYNLQPWKARRRQRRFEVFDY